MTKARKPSRANRGLASARAKVGRAKIHLKELQVVWDAFREKHPNAFGVRAEIEATQKRLYVSLQNDPPFDLSLIAGDALHNLRAALDHLAVALVCKGGVVDPNAKSARVRFPICKDAKHFSDRLDEDVPGICDEALKILNRLEPYFGGEGHAFHVLNQLDITDKHSLILKVEPVISGSVLYAPKPGVRGIFTVPIKPRTAEHGQEFYRSGGPFETNYNHHFELSIKPSFNEDGIAESEAVVPFIQQLVDLVEGTIDEFAVAVFGESPRSSA